MNDDRTLTGYVTRTSPPSTPLDTLKALVLRTTDRLDYVIDQLSGGVADVPEELLDFLNGIRLTQLKALAEHVPVAHDERLGELRHVHPDGSVYADGTPVIERFEERFGSSDYYPRYDGPREEALARHRAWVAQVEQQIEADSTFGEIITGIEWGHDGPPDR